MNFAVVYLTDGCYGCRFFGGFNATCRFAYSLSESGSSVYVYRNVGIGRVRPYFLLMHDILDGSLLYGSECPVHIDVIYDSFRFL